jgi:hypothetical protein
MPSPVRFVARTAGLFFLSLRQFHLAQNSEGVDKMAEWLWTWSGRSFGYREGDSLFAREGSEVGRFRDDEIFGPDGRYTGELRRGRLITNRRKRKRRGSFTPRHRAGRAGRANRAGYAMISGFEDFLDSED